MDREGRFAAFSHMLLLYLYTIILPTAVGNDHLSNELAVKLMVSEEFNKCSVENEESVSRCLKPIIEYASALQKQTSGIDSFALRGGEIFKQLCGLYTRFKACTKLVDCSSVAKRLVDASYAYMCGKGYDLFEQHAACFAAVEAQPDYISCKNAASEALNEASKAGGDRNEGDYFHRLCGVMDEYLQCCHPLVLNKCGDNAWRLVSRVTADSMRVTMPSCDLQHSLLL